MTGHHLTGADVSLLRDGLSLSAKVFGPSNATTVMLVHGFPDTPHSWDPMVPLLVDAGYRVLVPWLRGYTRDSVRRSARYDVMAVADDLAAWREFVDGSPVHLVGHDWGAIAGLIATKRRPEPWRTLSLLAIPPISGMAHASAAVRVLPRQAVKSFYIPLVQSGLSPRVLGASDAAAVQRLWRRWSPGWDFTDADFAPVRSVFTARDLAWATTRYYRALFTAHRASTREFYHWASAPMPPLPTLALAGIDDGCMDAALHRALSAATNTPSVLLDGCGHFLHAERPEVVTAELLDHFRAAETHA